MKYYFINNNGFYDKVENIMCQNGCIKILIPIKKYIRKLGIKVEKNKYIIPYGSGLYIVKRGKSLEDVSRED